MASRSLTSLLTLSIALCALPALAQPKAAPAPKATPAQDALKENFIAEHELGRRFSLDPAHLPPAEAKEVKVAVQLGKAAYKKGEPIEMTVTTSQPGYVYCFLQTPSTGKIQRIFPNRFMRDPHVEANTPITLPGAQLRQSSVR